MPAPRAVLALALTLSAGAACRVSTQQNELYEGDQLAEAAEATRPSPSRTASAALDASDLETSGDAAMDTDAAPLVAPPCAPLAIDPNETSSACAIEGWSVTGGDVPLGAFNLALWTRDKCANTSSLRRGSISLEEHGGKLFMRWIMVVDGNTSWGTYELTRQSPTAFLRREVCNFSAETPDAIASYGASASEIGFIHGDGSYERWTRPPRSAPPETLPGVEPSFK